MSLASRTVTGFGVVKVERATREPVTTTSWSVLSFAGVAAEAGGVPASWATAPTLTSGHGRDQPGTSTASAQTARTVLKTCILGRNWMVHELLPSIKGHGGALFQLRGRNVLCAWISLPKLLVT